MRNLGLISGQMQLEISLTAETSINTAWYHVAEGSGEREQGTQNPLSGDNWPRHQYCTTEMTFAAAFYLATSPKVGIPST